MNWKLSRQMVGLVGLVLVIAGGLLVVLASTSRAPTYYLQALRTPRHQSMLEGRMFERRLVELSNQLRGEDSTWSALWTESQLNGWLAADLAEKFPQFLPASIADPRVFFSDDLFQLVFRFQGSGRSQIVQVEGDIFATDVENQIAFRISEVRCGWLPIPISWWAEPLAASLRDSDIMLQWSEIGGDPVALLTLPSSLSAKTQQLPVLTAIQLTRGSFGIAGVLTPRQPVSSAD